MCLLGKSIEIGIDDFTTFGSVAVLGMMTGPGASAGGVMTAVGFTSVSRRIGTAVCVASLGDSSEFAVSDDSEAEVGVSVVATSSGNGESASL